MIAAHSIAVIDFDEYGWRHFGDLYADHEAVGHSGEHLELRITTIRTM